MEAMFNSTQVTVIAIDADHVQIGDHVYKRCKTENGRYTKETRRLYMIKYRENLKQLKINKAI
jgi:hypothetical protein